MKNFRLAFPTNVPERLRPIRRIDDTVFPVDDALFDTLLACCEGNVWTPL